MTENKTNIEDTQLEEVAGGDFGDLRAFDSEESVEYRYEVGEHVEVYLSTMIHAHTRGGTVVRRYPKQGTGIFSGLFYAAYDIAYDEGWTVYGKDEDNIERK